MNPQTTNAKSGVEVPFELEALSKSKRYQAWVASIVAPYYGNRILELGAGIGNMSRWLPIKEKLILTESNAGMCRLLENAVKDWPIENTAQVQIERFDVLTDDHSKYIESNLDTIISFNVLEHIENDFNALQKLCEILQRSKSKSPRRLVLFVPAHNWAYGNLDRYYGHYRRYSKKVLKEMVERIQPSAKVEFRHFNIVGLMGWIFTGKILRKSIIDLKSVLTFEALCPFIVPVDNALYKLTKLPVGQSILMVVTF